MVILVSLSVVHLSAVPCETSKPVHSSSRESNEEASSDSDDRSDCKPPSGTISPAFPSMAAMAQYIDRKVAALATDVDETSLQDTSIDEIRGKIAAMLPLAVVTRGRVEPYSGASSPGTSTPTAHESSTHRIFDLQKLHDETKHVSSTTRVSYRANREIPGFLSYRANREIPGFFPLDAVGVDHLSWKERMYEEDESKDRSPGFFRMKTNQFTYTGKVRIPGFFSLAAVDHAFEEEDTLCKHEESIDDRLPSFLFGLEEGLNDSSDERLPGFFSGLNAYLLTDEAETIHERVPGFFHVHDVDNTEEFGSIWDVESTDKRLPSFFVMDADVSTDNSNSTCNTKKPEKSTWEMTETHLFSPVGGDEQMPDWVEYDDSESPQYQWSHRALDVIPEEDSDMLNTPKHLGISSVSSVFVTPGESCIIDMSDAEDSSTTIEDSSFNSSRLTHQDDSFVSVASGIHSYLSLPSSRSDVGVNSTQSDNSMPGTPADRDLISNQSSGDSGHPASLDKLVLSPRSLSAGEEMLKCVLSPKSQSSMEEVPLEISALSQARETPPPKLTFRKRRSRGVSSKGSPASPLYQSTPTEDENPPTKKKKNIPLRAFMEKMPWSPDSPLFKRPFSADKEVQTPINVDDVFVGLSQARHIGVECNDLILESYISEPSMLTSPVAKNENPKSIGVMTNLLENAGTEISKRNVGTMIDLPFSHTVLDKRGKNVSFLSKDSDIDESVVNESLHVEIPMLPTTLRQCSPGHSHSIDGVNINDSIVITKTKFWEKDGRYKQGSPKKKYRNKGVQTSRRFMRRTKVAPKMESIDQNESRNQGLEKIITENQTEVKESWHSKLTHVMSFKRSTRKQNKVGVEKHVLQAEENITMASGEEHSSGENIQWAVLSASPNDKFGSLPSHQRKKMSVNRRLSLPMYNSASHFWKPKFNPGREQKEVEEIPEDHKENIDAPKDKFGSLPSHQRKKRSVNRLSSLPMYNSASHFWKPKFNPGREQKEVEEILENDKQKDVIQPVSFMPSVPDQTAELTYLGTLKRMGRLTPNMLELIDKYDILQPKVFEPREVAVVYATDSCDSVFTGDPSSRDESAAKSLTLDHNDESANKKHNRWTQMKPSSIKSGNESTSSGDTGDDGKQKVKRSRSFRVLDRLRRSISSSSQRSLKSTRSFRMLDRLRKSISSSSQRSHKVIDLKDRTRKEPVAKEVLQNIPTIKVDHAAGTEGYVSEGISGYVNEEINVSVDPTKQYKFSYKKLDEQLADQGDVLTVVPLNEDDAVMVSEIVCEENEILPDRAQLIPSDGVTNASIMESFFSGNDETEISQQSLSTKQVTEGLHLPTSLVDTQAEYEAETSIMESVFSGQREVDISSQQKEPLTDTSILECFFAGANTAEFIPQQQNTDEARDEGDQLFELDSHMAELVHNLGIDTEEPGKLLSSPSDGVTNASIMESFFSGNDETEISQRSECTTIQVTEEKLHLATSPVDTQAQYEAESSIMESVFSRQREVDISSQQKEPLTDTSILECFFAGANTAECIPQQQNTDEARDEGDQLFELDSHATELIHIFGLDTEEPGSSMLPSHTGPQHISRRKPVPELDDSSDFNMFSFIVDNQVLRRTHSPIDFTPLPFVPKEEEGLATGVVVSTSSTGELLTGTSGEPYSSQESFSLDSIEALPGSFAVDVETDSTRSDEVLILAESTDSFERLMADTSQNAQDYYSLTQTSLSPQDSTSMSADSCTPRSFIMDFTPSASLDSPDWLRTPEAQVPVVTPASGADDTLTPPRLQTLQSITSPSGETHQQTLSDQSSHTVIPEVSGEASMIGIMFGH